MNISFEYDRVLTDKKILKFVKSLINEQNNLFIITKRSDKTYPKNPDNKNVYLLAKELNAKLIFTEQADKIRFIEQNDIDFHYDYSEVQVSLINSCTKCRAFLVGKIEVI